MPLPPVHRHGPRGAGSPRRRAPRSAGPGHGASAGSGTPGRADVSLGRAPSWPVMRRFCSARSRRSSATSPCARWPGDWLASGARPLLPRRSGGSTLSGASLLKKTAHAAEQRRAQVEAQRRAWFDEQIDLEPERLVFVDETGTSTKMARRYGRAPKGERCRAPVPHGHWKTTTHPHGRPAPERHDRAAGAGRADDRRRLSRLR